jgi:hypothetical protein
MAVPGSGYLLAVAAIAMTFVSLSAIVLVLRQFEGGALTPYHTHVVRFTVECGLLATASALLPVLLELTELPAVVVYRLSSGAGAVGFLIYLVQYVRRYKRLMPGPLPLRFVIITTLSIVVVAMLLLNAGEIVLRGEAWPYAVAVTWILVQAGIVFLMTFDLFLQRPPADPARGDPTS